MKITSAKFVKGVVGEDAILSDGKEQITFLGRSNVGKSSVINSLANHKGLAKSSSYPGRTKEINFFLINDKFYLVDLPGYGYAKGSMDQQAAIQQLIYWYLHQDNSKPKHALLIVDAKVGFTKDDLDMLHSLHQQQLNVIVVANKIDKLNRNEQQRQLKALEAEARFYPVLPYSAEKKLGVQELWKLITA